MNARLDARWHAVKVVNNCSDNGGRRPTRQEFDQVYSLAYEVKTRRGINDRQLAEILCPQTDIKTATNRVWHWVKKGRASVI